MGYIKSPYKFDRVAAGKKARDTNLKKDPDFYRKIGTKGGLISRNGGFAADPELAREAGRKGGRVSRKPKKGTV